MKKIKTHEGVFTDSRAQFIIVGILILSLSAIVYAVFQPTLEAFLDPAIGNATARGDSGEAMLIALIPFVGWVVIVMAFFLLVASPQQQV